MAALLPLASAAHAAETIRPDKTELPLNQTVLAVAHSYANGGKFNSAWSGSGTPEEVLHGGVRILPVSTGGTYCSGFTFATVMKAARKEGLLEEKSVEEVRRFQKQWYGAVSDQEVREKQCALAVQNLGIGREVSIEQAEPGDFAQFWRGRSGHSVVFLGWALDEDGNRIGLKYRSSQTATDGIGNHVEHFQGEGKGRVDPNRIYFARLKKASGQ